ncbi:unnamed protein product [Parnassius mnemosyne]|uniref:Uncharacterized protein n=1 Tax=Parnassius mnemosyne TaxID=213953 RepID=A0AAV1M4S3_9NEOP
MSSRERLKQKQFDFEDLQLQVKIVETKLSAREAEFNERTEKLRRALDRLRKVRTRVRELIAANDEFRRAFETTPWDLDNTENIPGQEQEFIMELMKEFKCEQTVMSDRQTEKMECGEHVPLEPTSPENSVYSSVSDCQQDCQVKIVKVTNVYKVAYLRHFIKQKRLRRATKQALLKKKMENIKKILEDWQKTLNMVINSKLAILDMDPNRTEAATQDAIGDYTKPQLREYSDSDSDRSWNHNPYRNCTYCFEDVPDLGMSREFYEPSEYTDIKCESEYEGNRLKSPSKLFIVTEETSSQIAIEEVKSEAGDDWDCRDTVAM